MVPEERTVSCGLLSQDREADPRFITLHGRTIVEPGEPVRFREEGPRNEGGLVGMLGRR